MNGESAQEMKTTNEKHVWGPWATAGFGLIIGVLFVLTQTAVTLAYVSFKYGGLDELDRGILSSLSTNGLVIALSTFASALVCGIDIIVLARIRKGITVAEYLDLKPVRGRTLFALTGILIGFILVSDLVTHLLGREIIPEFMIDAYRTRQSTVLFAFAIVFAAPLFEEFFFRGFLLEGFRRSRMGAEGAVVLTSFVWSLIHVQYGVYEQTIIFLLGMLFGFVKIRTGSLWACVFMHSFLNLAALLEVIAYVRFGG